MIFISSLNFILDFLLEELMLPALFESVVLLLTTDDDDDDDVTIL